MKIEVCDANNLTYDCTLVLQSSHFTKTCVRKKSRTPKRKFVSGVRFCVEYVLTKSSYLYLR